MSRSRKRSSLRKRRIGFIVVLLALASLAAVIGIWHHSSRKVEIGTTTSGAKVNLSPATDQDKQADNLHKAELGNENNQSASASNGSSSKTAATPVVTSVSSTSVKALVQGVVESGGTCTATLTEGSSTVTGSATGVPNASDTICSINVSPALGKGTWSVEVSYSSATAQGSSSSQNFEVP